MNLALYLSRVRSSEVLADIFRWRHGRLKSAKSFQRRPALIVSGYAFTHDLSVPGCLRDAYEHIRQDYRWFARGAGIEESLDIGNAVFSCPFVDRQER